MAIVLNKNNRLFLLFILCALWPATVFAEEPLPSKVDMASYIALAKQVETYRKDHLVHVDEFLKLMRSKNTIILDARSKEMFDRMHIQGAVNLNFSDFTAENLQRIIPDRETRILIYCNNNFDNAPLSFPTKAGLPLNGRSKEPLLLALNVPVFINLYGYGYRNIYELADFVSVGDERLKFVGTAVADPAQH